MFHAMLWCFGYISEQNQPNDILLFTLKSNAMINNLPPPLSFIKYFTKRHLMYYQYADVVSEFISGYTIDNLDNILSLHAMNHH